MYFFFPTVSESVNFDGHSYFTKDLHFAIASESESIRFRFRTNNADGVVLYSRGSQGDFFALQLIHNKLLLNIDLGKPVFIFYKNKYFHFCVKTFAVHKLFIFSEFIWLIISSVNISDYILIDPFILYRWRGYCN